MILIFDQDIVEQVYHEMGIGSVIEIHDFYQSRIINHHASMQQTCAQLMAEYEKLKQPIMVKQMDTVPVIRCPGLCYISVVFLLLWGGGGVEMEKVDWEEMLSWYLNKKYFDEDLYFIIE